MRRRILTGLGANAVGQLANTAIQFFSLPVYLHYWSKDSYGAWLLLSAAPAYLAMSDIGMVNVAANKMAMALGRSDETEANRIFQSAQLFVFVICISLALILTPVMLWGPFPVALSGGERGALLILCFQVLLTLVGSLVEAVFRVTNRYALGVAFGTLLRIVEWFGSICGLVLFDSFFGVAICGLLARICVSVYAFLVAGRENCGLHWGVAKASRKEIFELAHPALAFMAFPLSNALNIQGMTLIVGATQGPAAVSVFNAYRTIARVVIQLTTMFSLALWPEFSRLYGRGEKATVLLLYRHGTLVVVSLAVSLSVLIYFLSPRLLQIWSGSQIEFLQIPMFWMLTYAAVGGTWSTPRVLLMATNEHAGLARWSLISALTGVILTYVFGFCWPQIGAPLAMVVSETLLAFTCFILGGQLLRKHWPV